MELILIKPQSNEWNYLWEWLAIHPINEDLEEPQTALHNGFAWEYMGSYMNGKKVLHTFKHRFHPKTLKEHNLALNASKDFTIDDIATKTKI